MRLIYFLILICCFNFVCGENASFSSRDAQIALDTSLNIIDEFKLINFPISFINDTYIEAKIIFQQVNYSDILKNSSISEKDPLKIEAKIALRFVNFKNITYADVILHTNEITRHQAEAYEIYDSLEVLNKRIENYSLNGINVSVAESLFLSANKSFYQDQFNDSFNFIEKTQVQLESDKIQMSSVSLLKENAKNFIYRYWYALLSLLIILLFMVYFFIGKLKFYLLKEKISKMEIEEKVLLELIKKNQTERFKEDKISGIVYNIRMKKYEERLNEIKRELPVSKKNLARIEK